MFNLVEMFCDLSNISGLIILLKRIDKLKFYATEDMLVLLPEV